MPELYRKSPIAKYTFADTSKALSSVGISFFDSAARIFGSRLAGSARGDAKNFFPTQYYYYNTGSNQVLTFPELMLEKNTGCMIMTPVIDYKDNTLESTYTDDLGRKGSGTGIIWKPLSLNWTEFTNLKNNKKMISSVQTSKDTDAVIVTKDAIPGYRPFVLVLRLFPNFSTTMKADLKNKTIITFGSRFEIELDINGNCKVKDQVLGTVIGSGFIPMSDQNEFTILFFPIPFQNKYFNPEGEVPGQSIEDLGGVLPGNLQDYFGLLVSPVEAINGQTNLYGMATDNLSGFVAYGDDANFSPFAQEMTIHSFCSIIQIQLFLLKFGIDATSKSYIISPLLKIPVQNEELSDILAGVKSIYDVVQAPKVYVSNPDGRSDGRANIEGDTTHIKLANGTVFWLKNITNAVANLDSANFTNGIFWDRDASSNNAALIYRWALELKSNDANTFTPFFWGIVSFKEPYTVNVENPNGHFIAKINDLLNPIGNIGSDNLLSGNVSHTLEESTLSCVFNNYKQDTLGRIINDGIFNEFTGIHRAELNLSHPRSDETALIPRSWRQFTGWATDPVFKMSKDGSTVTFTHFNLKWRLQNDAFAINLPIYDGWCILRALRNLGLKAGLQDDEMVYQDKAEFDLIDQYTLLSLCDNDSCRRGICPHHKLQLAGWQDQPVYKLEDGTPIWECMLKVIDEEQGHLRINHWNRLVYSSPSTHGSLWPVFRDYVSENLSRDEYAFYEIPWKSSAETFIQSEDYMFNEFWDLEIRKSVSLIRNGGRIMALQQTTAKKGFLEPFIIDWNLPLNDSSEDHWAPWRRMYFERKPIIVQKGGLGIYSEEKFKRLTRIHWTCTFTTWGRPNLYPYTVIEIHTDRNPAGLGKIYTSFTDQDGNIISENRWVVYGVSHNFNAASQEFTTTVQCEWLDPRRTWAIHP